MWLICADKILWAKNKYHNNNTYHCSLETVGFWIYYCIRTHIQEVSYTFCGSFPFSQQSVFLQVQYKFGNLVQPNMGPSSEFKTQWTEPVRMSHTSEPYGFQKYQQHLTMTVNFTLAHCTKTKSGDPEGRVLFHCLLVHVKFPISNITTCMETTFVSLFVIE